MAPYAVLTACAVIARLAVFVRLFASELLGRYIFFAMFILSGVVQNAAWLFGTPRDAAYAHWWVSTVPISIALSIAAVVELWNLVASEYPGVRVLYRWIVPIVVGLGIGLAILSGVAVPAWQPTIFRIWSLAVRYNASVLAIVCGSVAWWMSSFPPAPKNLERHALILLGYFSFTAGSGLIVSMLGGYNVLAGPILTGIQAAFLGMWALRMNRAGELSSEPEPVDGDPKREIEGLLGLMRAVIQKEIRLG